METGNMFSDPGKKATLSQSGRNLATCCSNTGWKVPLVINELGNLAEIPRRNWKMWPRFSSLFVVKCYKKGRNWAMNLYAERNQHLTVWKILSFQIVCSRNRAKGVTGKPFVKETTCVTHGSSRPSRAGCPGRNCVGCSHSEVLVSLTSVEWLSRAGLWTQRPKKAELSSQRAPRAEHQTTEDDSQPYNLLQPAWRGWELSLDQYPLPPTLTPSIYPVWNGNVYPMPVQPSYFGSK